MPLINYLWVGEPTKMSANSIAGHDVAGPIEMARSLKEDEEHSDTKIQFWCLEEHIPFYKAQFTEALVSDAIQLCSIESALTASNRPEAKALLDLLPKAKSPDVKDRVSFKDGFSLFVLLTQGGFFFDTNIFPVDGEPIDWDEFLDKKQVMTGRSIDAKNDFYLMYSPEPYHPIVQEVLEKWLIRPVLFNLDAFRISQDIPILDPFDIELMGFKKISYKSYHSDAQGLFFWLDTQKIIPYLDYGDINRTTSFQNAIRPLCDFNLADVMLEDWKKINIPENLDIFPFTSDRAFVSKKNNIYFVDRTKTPYECTLIDNGYSKYLTSSDSTQDLEVINKDLMLMDPFIIHLVIKSKGKLPYIANLENCTLLHHAVFSKNVPLIKALIDAGARQDIKASYKWYLSEDKQEVRELTPIELAQELGDKEVLEAFDLATDLAFATKQVFTGSATFYTKRQKISKMESKHEEDSDEAKPSQKDSSVNKKTP